MASRKKQRIITFYSQLKSDFGHVEIKFDFKESDLKKMTKQNGEGDVLTSQFAIALGIDTMRQFLEKLTGQKIHTKESCFYELPRK